MEKKENLKTSIVFSFISQLICYLAPLIVSPYLSRVLGASGVGEYSYAYSYVFYFSSAILFGFSSYGINQISERRNDKLQYSTVFWTILFERFCFFVVSLSIYILLIYFHCFDESINSSILYVLSLILVANVFDISFLFQGLEQFRIVSYGQMVVNVAYLICVFLFVKSSDDLLFYTLIKSLIGLGLDGFLWMFSIKKITKPHIDKKAIVRIFMASSQFFLPTILMSAGTQIDQTFIGLFCGNKEVAYYQQASKIPSLISNFIYAIAPVMLSRISFLFKENKIEEVKEKIGKATNLALFLSIPCCLGVYLIGNYFVPTYFGEEYLPAINVLYCLLPVTLFSPLSSILINSYYYPCNEIKKAAYFLAMSLILNSLLTFIFTKYTNLGAKGAAIATLFAEIFLFSLLLKFSKNILSFKTLFCDLWKVLVASAFMCLGVFLINYFAKDLSQIIICIIDILSGIVIFFLFSCFLKEKIIVQVLLNIKSKLSKKREK